MVSLGVSVRSSYLVGLISYKVAIGVQNEWVLLLNFALKLKITAYEKT